MIWSVMRSNVLVWCADPGHTRKHRALTPASARTTSYMASFQMPAKREQPYYNVLADFCKLFLR